MRFQTIALAAAAAAIATPAYADESRIEARGGVAWCCGVSDETIGVAVGHDFDLKSTLFIGVEAVADTDFNFTDPVIGVNARLGAKVGEDTKVFALAGYAYSTGIELDDAVVGAGVQHNVGQTTLLSLQYQRSVDFDINRVLVGVGVRF